VDHDGTVRAKLAVLGAVGLAAGAGAAWLAAHRSFVPYQTAGVAFCLLVGWSFIGCGLVAWRQRPRNRLGPVMIFVGFAWFATFLTDARGPLLFTAGTAVQSLYLVGFAYLVLSFPSGRLSGRLEHALLWSAIAVTTVFQIAAMLTAASGPVLCHGCPANLLEVGRNDRLAGWLLQAERLAGAALAVATLVLLISRWRRASAAQRRAVAPVLWAGGVTLLALTASVVNDIAAQPLGQVPKQVLWAAVAALPVAIVAVLLQRRLARGAVAGLVVELGGRDTASDLREALGRALGDPSVQLAYWFADGQRYVDGDGRPARLPGPEANRATTMVENAGRPVAALIHDPALRENPELVDSVCAAAGLMLEKERLQAELRARLAELKDSRARMAAAAEAERRRIERDLHDGTQQRLVSITMSLGLLESMLPADPAAAAPVARRARQALEAALDELRELSQGILPGILAERGLPAALLELCGRAALPARLEVTVDRRLPAPVETAAYFLVSEALTNAAKHAQAGQAHVTARCADGLLTVEVADDGVGGAAAGGGSGLRGMADRVEALGGRFILSSPEREGTVVRAEVPCG
jgi:signal transduction histidine kinase